MAFATGKYSQAICDRCGYQYPYLELRKEWNGLFVCPECYEPKHPQLDPPYHAADPEALKNARPDREEPIVVPVGNPNQSLFTSNGMQPSQVKGDLIMRSSVGKVTVSTS
jgi:NAD-dependent SIR2 family protein deacetylase